MKSGTPASHRSASRIFRIGPVGISILTALVLAAGIYIPRAEASNSTKHSIRAPRSNATKPTTGDQPTKPLADILNSDGSINVVKGANGNYDVNGYKMVLGPQNEPRFVPDVTATARDTAGGGSKFTPHAGPGAAVIYNTTHGSTQGAEITPAGTGPATSLGDVIVLGGTNRTVCQIQIEVFTLASTAPFNLTMSLYTDSSTNDAGNSPCGNGVGTLIPGSTVTVNNVTPPAVSTIFNVTFPYPNVDISSETDNTISVVLNASRSDVLWRIGETPTVGSTPDGAMSFVTRCGSTGTNNGCQRNFGLTNNFAIQIMATPPVGGTGTCANGTINAIAVDGNGNIYVGGTFTELDTLPLSRVAMWNGTAWVALGDGSALANNGVDNNVNALAIDGGNNVYVGGTFQSARNSGVSSVPASRIARWNGTTWSALGDGSNVNNNGVNNSVNALAFDGLGNLYVGGFFTEARTNAGTRPATSRVARWNGTAWFALGDGSALANNGSGSPVTAIAVDSLNNVYIGGNFTQTRNGAGMTVPTARVAMWNGTVWSALGDGSNVANNGVGGGGVNSIVVDSNDDVFIGFASGVLEVRTSAAVKIPAARVAKWDGAAWSALGDPASSTSNGVDFDVAKLAMIGNNLFVGGRFSQARNNAGSTVPTSRIAMWNGTAWSALGDGSALANNGLGTSSAAVAALAARGMQLLVGGFFTEARTNGSTILETENLASWTGTNWTGVSSCPGDTVPPTLTKAFMPTQIVQGATSTLTFTITNPNTAGLTGIAFTDTLPAGVVVATPNGLTSTCTGTVTATAGSGSIMFAGGTLAGSASCTFSVTVQGLTLGEKVNTTSAITSTETGPGATATATLTVLPTTEFNLLYVADTQNHRVQRFDGLAWSVIAGTGVPGIAPNQCNLPEAVTADLFGQKIFVADTGNNRITFSTDGGATWAVFASNGIGLNQVNGPQGLALDQLGNLYVSDTGNRRVLRFNNGTPGFGVLLANNGIGTGQVGSPRGLAVDTAFNLFVADRTGNRVIRIATANVVATANTGTTVASGPGIALTQVNGPEGVAVDNAGNLYVADTGGNRVLRFAGGLPGTATLMTNGPGGLLGFVSNPEGVTISLFTQGPFAGQLLLVVGDTGNSRVQGRLLAGGPFQLVGAPNGFGSPVGQFRNDSKIR